MYINRGINCNYSLVQFNDISQFLIYMFVRVKDSNPKHLVKIEEEDSKPSMTSFLLETMPYNLAYLYS